MKQEIINLLKEHKGIRRREIADYLDCWVASNELTDALASLEKEGVMYAVIRKDTDITRSYIAYYLTEG